LVWSIGASASIDSRKNFDTQLKKLCNGDSPDIKLKYHISLPDQGQLFDYIYDIKKGKIEGEWISQLDSIDKNEAISNKQYFVTKLHS